MLLCGGSGPAFPWLQKLVHSLPHSQDFTLLKKEIHFEEVFLCPTMLNC